MKEGFNTFQKERTFPKVFSMSSYRFTLFLSKYRKVLWVKSKRLIINFTMFLMFFSIYAFALAPGPLLRFSISFYRSSAEGLTYWSR